MKRRLVTLILILVGLLHSACTPAPAATAIPPTPRPVMNEPTMAPQQSEVHRPQAASSPAQRRIVIQNIDLTIIVDDPGSAMDTIARMTDEMGGFVVESRLYKVRSANDQEIPEGNIIVRVPAERLIEAHDRIKHLAVDPEKDILAENKTGQDVTEEYADLEAQLLNQENAGKQLRTIMENANRTEDVLKVFDQLTQTRNEIERIKGKLQYYEQAASLSAISIRLQARQIVPPITVAGWQPDGILHDAIQALIHTGQGIVTALIWLVVYILPQALLCYVVFLVLRHFYRRRRHALPPAPPAAKE